MCRQREVRVTDLGVQFGCMHISPDRLLILRAVAASGGVGAAARQLHLAPSGISQHLARLERETGLVLVDRFHSGGQRPLRLTAAGQRLAAHGGRLADVLADAAEDIYAMSERLSGTVNVGGVLLGDDPSGRAGDPRSRAASPRRTGAGARGQRGPGAVRSPRRGPRCGSRRGREPGRPVHPSWTRAHLAPRRPVPGRGARRPGRCRRSLDDLASRPWISGPPGTAVQLVLDRVRRSTGLDLPATHVCEEFAAVLALVEAGLGASIVPALALPVEERPGLRLVGLSRVRRTTPQRRDRGHPAPATADHRDASRPCRGGIGLGVRVSRSRPARSDRTSCTPATAITATSG